MRKFIILSTALILCLTAVASAQKNKPELKTKAPVDSTEAIMDSAVMEIDTMPKPCAYPSQYLIVKYFAKKFNVYKVKAACKKVFSYFQRDIQFDRTKQIYYVQFTDLKGEPKVAYMENVSRRIFAKKIENMVDEAEENIVGLIKKFKNDPSLTYWEAFNKCFSEADGGGVIKGCWGECGDECNDKDACICVADRLGGEATCGAELMGEIIKRISNELY